MYFIRRSVGKWTYFLRTIPNISDLLRPLEIAITGEFIPAITGQSVGELTRKKVVYSAPFLCEWEDLAWVTLHSIVTLQQLLALSLTHPNWLLLL